MLGKQVLNNEKLRISQIAIGIMVLLLGISVPLRASGVATQQAAMGLAAIIALGFFILSLQVRAQVNNVILRPNNIWFGAVLITWTIGINFSFDPMASVQIYGRSVLFVCLSVMIWAVLVIHPQRHEFMWKVLLVSGVVLFLLVVLALSGVPWIVPALKGRLVPAIVSNFTYKAFAASAMCLMPIVVWAGRRLGGVWIWAGYSILPMSVFIIINTSNRAALAGMACMIILFSISVMFTHRKHRLKIFTGMFVCVGGVITWVGMHELTSIGKNATASPLYLPYWLVDEHRQNIWSFVFQRFLENPWFGNGIDQ